MNSTDRELLDFIAAHPTPWHVVEGQAALLEAAGYVRVEEGDDTPLRPGGRYYITRGGSALMALRLPEALPEGFHIVASHSDNPVPVVKEDAEQCIEGRYTRLAVEIYGGALLAPWFDRPLGAAGRLFVRSPEGPRQVTVDMERDLLMIPSLAIHMDREANKGRELNPRVDMCPLYGLGGGVPPLRTLLAEKAGVKPEDVLGSDILVYSRQPGIVWGADDEFLSSPRLDDVQCAFASLQAFLSAAPGKSIAVHALFDNEETGSSTRQGAASTFLEDTLRRAAEAYGLGDAGYRRLVARSFLLSADNAHGLHPNCPDKCDAVHRPVLGGGVVLKFAANRKYTTDGYSAAVTRLLAEKAGVTLQTFTNRSDMPGGSTLGNISACRVPVPAADIGVAQLAMHSPFETCGAGDTEQMIRLMRAQYEA